jgi:hypothetical protein
MFSFTPWNKLIRYPQLYNKYRHNKPFFEKNSICVLLIRRSVCFAINCMQINRRIAAAQAGKITDRGYPADREVYF